MELVGFSNSNKVKNHCILGLKGAPNWVAITLIDDNLPDGCMPDRTGKCFRNLFKSTRNQILFTIFRLIWNQTDVHLNPNQSENSKYNLISGWFNMISKRFLCVWVYWVQSASRGFVLCLWKHGIITIPVLFSKCALILFDSYLDIRHIYNEVGKTKSQPNIKWYNIWCVHVIF